MSETYWLSSVTTSLAELPTAFPQALQRSNLQPNWIVELHILGRGPLPGLNLPATSYIWPVDSIAAQRLLNLLIDGVQRNNPELLALIEIPPAGQPVTALVLGSPTAAGRHNLLPLARLHSSQPQQPITPIEPLPLNGLLLPFHQALADRRSGSLTQSPLTTLLEVL
jgi:hypothetical protein